MAIIIQDIINQLERNILFKDNLEHIEIIDKKEADFGNLKIKLSPPVLEYLSRKKIKLYRHQCQVIHYLTEGRNVIITTPTASGKTLAFNIPVFEAMISDHETRALYLYPTKALSQDQLKVIKDFERTAGSISLTPRIYDGDTSPSQRPVIRETSRIIISNPYELHQILPFHSKWQKFFKNLKFIVLDEAHRYRGVFGSHIAYVIRRLLRIAQFYGSTPQFILSTATLANPLEFAEKLTGCGFNLVNEDSSPHGKKYFIFYNPYSDGTQNLSSHQHTKNLFLFFIKQGLQTLCFTVSRKMAELVSFWARQDLKRMNNALSEMIMSYRAGYLPLERRKIENDLKHGLLKGVATTNALELGIDIGSLDCVIISGYPGTVISTWQQAGRAGRGIEESIVVMVAFQNPLDQYFMKHPGTFFDKSCEHAVIDLDNEHIVSGHLLCATSELPLIFDKDQRYLPSRVDIMEEMQKHSLVQKTPHGWVYKGVSRATEVVSLENISSEVFKIICEKKLIGTLDREQAIRETYPGAIFLHGGQTYLVEELDLKSCHVHISQKEVDYYTQSLEVADIKILKELDRQRKQKIDIVLGEVEVKEHHTGYKIIKYDKIIGTQKLDLPALRFQTIALYITFPHESGEKMRIDGIDFAGSLHGMEHALISVFPFHVMCDRWDIGGVSTVLHPQTAKPSVFIYDGFEGGIGLAEKAIDLLQPITQMAFDLVKDCPCEEGCPSCIYSPKCGNENKPMDKKGTIFLLGELLDILKK
ncbi:MAG: DEAD/DEAH box helicase [Spirochaetes bacterium]|nr:DEAD/DEAH box helicase [Spirochaetota bacterium]